MTSESLAAVAGVVLSLAFSYVPGLNAWFDKLEPTHKRLVMLVLIVLVAAGAFGLSCARLYDFVACSQQGAITLLNAVIAAAVANQATYLLSPKAQ